MKVLSQSAAMIAMSFALVGGLSAHASSTNFLCGIDLLKDPELQISRRTESVLAFFHDQQELPVLDHVVKSYLEMTRGLPKAQVLHRLKWKGVVMEVNLWQAPVIQFRNTHDVIYENKHLMETLLNESHAMEEIMNEHAGEILQLRKSIREIR